jgi:hypothetical protein
LDHDLYEIPLSCGILPQVNLVVVRVKLLVYGQGKSFSIS